MRLFTSKNPEVVRLADTLTRLAPSELPILLAGETGSGKSFTAARLHRHGRAGRPFVVVDCGAVPETLLPSELFGHRAGAFTDATHARVGLLERAGDGTLVLDRVDALSGEAQVMLLRVLEERRFTPVGSSTPRSFRARVVSLASEGLSAGAGSRFRADLYHRLAGFHAALPPLRRRREDILPFARTVLRRRGRETGGSFSLPADTETLLLAYPWPGNFRELATVLERACLLLGDGALRPESLGLPATGWESMAALAAERALPVDVVARLYALLVLAGEGGNVSRAARTLGVSRRTLIRWRQGS